MQSKENRVLWKEEVDQLLKQLKITPGYGLKAMTQLRIHSHGEEKALFEKLDTIEDLIRILSTHAYVEKQIYEFFRTLPDIHQELEDLLLGYVPTYESCLKLKLFLLQHGVLELKAPVLFHEKVFPVSRFLHRTMCLHILDPGCQGLPTFYLDGSFSLTLMELRSQKRKLDQHMKGASEEELPCLLELRQKIVDKEVLEEDRTLQQIAKALYPFASEWYEYILLLSDFELSFAKACMAIQRNMVRPQLSKTGSMSWSGLRHPLVEEYLLKKKQQYIPVDVECEPGTTVITGANMSGKSVTMRAIFINCFLFQAGFFVFASGANLPLFEQLTFLEEARHDAEQGISSFASEVMQLQHHIDLYKDRFVLLGLDEFARSTNPDEGTALVQAVTSYFNQLRGFTIIATHYDDVAEEAKRHYRVRGFSHVDEQVTQELALSNEPLLKLQKYMDYRLDLVLSKEQIPKEARLICRTFRLEPEILSYMEKKITKENM